MAEDRLDRSEQKLDALAETVAVGFNNVDARFDKLTCFMRRRAIGSSWLRRVSARRTGR